MYMLLGAIVFLVIVGAVVLIASGAGFRGLRRQQLEHREDVLTHRVDALRYQVPVGQDPAALVAALRLEGYEVVTDTDQASQDILILTPAGADRERARVRSVIEHDAPIDMEGHPMPDHEVRFADEQQAG